MEKKIEMLAQIYSMQADLNRKTLGKNDVDWDEVLCSVHGECPAAAELWIENYRKALSSEFVEYLVSDKQTKNAKIEVVDILHFLVSIAEIVGVPPFNAIGYSGDSSTFNGVSLSRAILVTLDNLQNAVPFKWWGSGAKLDINKAVIAVEDLFSIFGIIMGEMNMSWEDVYDIYKKKNAVNHQRQDSGYDLSKKTEADNESIVLATTVVLAADYAQAIDYEAECAISPDGEKPKSSERCDAGEAYGNMLYQPIWPAVYPLEDDGDE